MAMDEESVESCTACPEIVAGENADHPVSLASAKQRQSRSHLGKMNSSMICKGNGVDEFLECPVCSRSLLPHIHQCQDGHTFCSNCKTRAGSRCSTHGLELGDIRCQPLEEVAESLELSCMYNHLGCTETFPYYIKLKHEVICSFRPHICPYAGSDCTVTGDIPYLVTHLRDYHGVDMHLGQMFNHRYVKSNPRKVDNATWMLTAFQLGMAPVYMAFLRFMGEEIDAQKYGYSLEIGGNGRKLIWEGKPRSIRDSHRKVRDSYDGLIIQQNIALFFSGGNRTDMEGKQTKNPDRS